MLMQKGTSCFRTRGNNFEVSRMLELVCLNQQICISSGEVVHLITMYTSLCREIEFCSAFTFVCLHLLFASLTLIIA